MPRISKVVWPQFKLDYGFLFDIQNEDELMDWFENIRLPASKDEFVDAAHSAEMGGTGGHATTGGPIAYMANVTGRSLVDVLGKLNQDMLAGMLRAVRATGHIFINGKGGYFSPTGQDMKISETQNVEKWILPSETFRIIQWPSGSHFYAKVGNQDVVVQGKQKWDSYADAESAAKAFLAKSRRVSA